MFTYQTYFLLDNITELEFRNQIQNLLRAFQKYEFRTLFLTLFLKIPRRIFVLIINNQFNEKNMTSISL